MRFKSTKQLEEMKMKDIVPYTPNEKKTIEKTVGVDITNNIPPVHVAYASFVVEEAMTRGFVDLGDVEGKYTGWWLGGSADGRGTWRSNNGKRRFDAIWKNGVPHGTGRCIVSESDGYYQEQINEGAYENGGNGEGTKCYLLSSGSKLANIWSKQQDNWIRQ